MTASIQGGESTVAVDRRIPMTAAPNQRRDTCSPPSLADRCDIIWRLLEVEIITADRFHILGYHEMADSYERRAQQYVKQLEQLSMGLEVAA